MTRIRWDGMWVHLI